MAIEFGPQNYVISLKWSSVNFARGFGATVLGFSGPTESQSTVEDLTLVVVDLWSTTMNSLLDSNYGIESVRVESMSYSTELVSPQQGTRSGASAPPNTSVLDVKTAAGKGPRYRGRNYWPGLLGNTAVNENGIINPVAVQDIDEALTNFYNGFGLISPVFTLSLPQSNTETQKTPPVVPWPVVTSRGVSARAATQRRRLRA